MNWTEEEIQKLIDKAILKERLRIADKINNSSAEYIYNYGNGSTEFNWDKTVTALAKDIIETIWDTDEEESKSESVNGK